MAEDYVEAIAAAIEDHGKCRATDLVQQFRVTHATVHNTVGRLVRDGLVETEPYQPITLTPAGKRMAVAARRRHELVEQFLRKLGVSSRTASVDAEGIEHHVSRETLKAMRALVDSDYRAS